MKNSVILFFLLLISQSVLMAQDTTLINNKAVVTLPEVWVRNNFDYNKLLNYLKNDTSFYKAFKNLRVLNFTSLNDIRMLNKKGDIIASMSNKTFQKRKGGCRTMETVNEKFTGDFYGDNNSYNYYTANMFASLFFTKGSICGENNIVSKQSVNPKEKSGFEKHKEQLKMLFFQPGKKIPGIPFIGNKLDLFDEKAKTLYNYKLDIVEFHGKNYYSLAITPKEYLNFLKRNEIVVNEMETLFDIKTLEVVKRIFSLSYNATFYDFDVKMEVELTRMNELLVPSLIRYKGNWKVVFKKREIGEFTSMFYDYKGEMN